MILEMYGHDGDMIELSLKTYVDELLRNSPCGAKRLQSRVH